MSVTTTNPDEMAEARNDFQKEITGHGRVTVKQDALADCEYFLQLERHNRKLPTELIQALADRDWAIEYIGEHQDDREVRAHTWNLDVEGGA